MHALVRIREPLQCPASDEGRSLETLIGQVGSYVRAASVRLQPIHSDEGVHVCGSLQPLQPKTFANTSRGHTRCSIRCIVATPHDHHSCSKCTKPPFGLDYPSVLTISRSRCQALHAPPCNLAWNLGLPDILLGRKWTPSILSECGRMRHATRLLCTQRTDPIR